MDVVPVIDLMQGLVVRGIAGRRAEYRPVESVLGCGAQPIDVARAFVEQFGFRRAYVADLDAISTGTPSLAIYHQLATAGLELWLDAGIKTVADLVRLAQGLRPIADNTSLIVGLESLADPTELRNMLTVVAPERLIFSLDLKQGVPITAAQAWHGRDAEQIVDEAIKLGITRLIVLDLAHVGSGTGPQVAPLCERLRAKYPCVELIAGGGVRSIDDLQTLAAAGCDAALVASALHNGSLTPAKLATITDASHALQRPRPIIASRKS